ncbi:hypothetical protein [Sphingomonas sp. UYP23]
MRLEVQCNQTAASKIGIADFASGAASARKKGPDRKSLRWIKVMESMRKSAPRAIHFIE